MISDEKRAELRAKRARRKAQRKWEKSLTGDGSHRGCGWNHRVPGAEKLDGITQERPKGVVIAKPPKPPKRTETWHPAGVHLAEVGAEDFIHERTDRTSPTKHDHLNNGRGRKGRYALSWGVAAQHGIVDDS